MLDSNQRSPCQQACLFSRGGLSHSPNPPVSAIIFSQTLLPITINFINLKTFQNEKNNIILYCKFTNIF